MLKYGEPNILTIKNLRRITSHCPPHFEKVHFSMRGIDKDITDWIWENLSGRFYFGTVDIPSESGKGYSRSSMAAFEIASEASMFSFHISSVTPSYHFG